MARNRKKKTPPQGSCADPVLSYANDVTAGRIANGPHVRYRGKSGNHKLAASFSQFDPKQKLQRGNLNGRVGWVSASPLPGLQFGKRSFCLWRGLAGSGLAALGNGNAEADIRS
jgi:hypothetical protein